MIRRLNFMLAGLICLSAMSQTPAQQKPTRPNVVIFFTDDQGMLDVNCYGSADLYTPTMDNLAAWAQGKHHRRVHERQRTF